MATTQLKELLNDAVEESLKLNWEIHHQLAPVDEILKNEKYWLVFSIENCSEGLRFDRISVRLWPVSSEAFGEHVRFYDGIMFANPVSNVLFEFESLPPKRQTGNRVAFFEALVHLRRGTGDPLIGVFQSQIWAEIYPSGVYTKDQRW